MNQGQI